MLTKRFHPSSVAARSVRTTRGALTAAPTLAIAAAGVAAMLAVSSPHGAAPAPAPEGRAPSGNTSEVPSIAAYFARRSYARGELAHLILHRPIRGVRVEILRAGTTPARAREPGTRVVPTRTVAARARSIAIRVGSWPSGLYFARLTKGPLVGYAPFVLRPRRLGEARVAVVLPTNTWQAYNFRDQTGDGVGDTWYDDPSRSTVRVDRGYLDRGIPPHYRHYDRGFLRWLVLGDREPDYLAQEDVEAASGAALRRAYELIVFPGHHEYVTLQEYDAIERYRDLGGNLAFLSANNFFWRVDRSANLLVRVAKWRDVGRPEAGLVGVQYVDWYKGVWVNRPYVVVGAQRARWLFADTGLGNGDRFAKAGIEIDARREASPGQIQLLAVIPNAFGPGKSAEMTYYTTRNGAKVFAAGAFTLAGQALWRDVSPLLDNLWRELSSA